MLEAVANIERWSNNEAVHSDQYQSAVLHELGVIGEAAAHLSQAFRRAHSEIPWQQIVGMRNMLIHRYWDTAWGIVEEVLRNDLPLLKTALGSPVEDDSGTDIEEMLAIANKRPALGDANAGRRSQQRTCDAWMPIARSRCTLSAGHSGHHRSA